MKNSLKTLTLLAALAVLGASSAQAALPYSVTFRNFFGATFTRPVQFIPYPGEDSAYIVLQQGGKILTVRRQNGAWARTDSAVITVLNGTSTGNEQGLLGLTFHPDFRQNRKYYVYYVAPGASNGYDQIAERTADVTLRPHTGDAQRTILRLLDPYSNHNSGTLGFGPNDGYLYFALGDGGSGGDPQGRAQNTDSLFGKFLRFDVNGVDAYPADTTRNYAVPSDNPFVGQAGRRPEIWAYGVRNPFRWSFHPVTKEIWVGDVGQDYVEEISHVTKGANMGWDTREGNTCFNANSVTSPLSSCNMAGMSPSVIDVLQPKAQSITGGVFFMGSTASAFNGAYIFGDYVTDSVWAARIVNDSAVERIRIGAVNAVASFNLDLQGRVFAVSIEDGVVYALESPDMAASPTPIIPGRSRRNPASGLLHNPSGFELRNLQGQKVSGLEPGNGLYVVRRLGDHAASLIPILK